MKTIHITGILLLVHLVCIASAFADVDVRLSVKIILDANGNRPGGALSTDEQIQGLVTAANVILASTGRGFRFVLSESVVPVAGHSEFFSPADPPDPDGSGPLEAPDPRETHLNALDAASAADCGGFSRRSNAVNCYFNARDYTAICSFPDSATAILLFGQSSFATSLAHEVGHFFNLMHTHQGDSGKKGQTPPQTLIAGNGDLCADTEPDHNEWDLDDIAVMLGFSSNAVLQASSDSAAKGRSLRIWRNLMSYHDPAGRSRLSDDQMDRWTGTANGARLPMCNGRTWFVANGGSDGAAGTNAAVPFSSLSYSLTRITTTNDVVLLRAGTYAAQASGILSTPCTLRATRGAVTVTRP